MTPPQVFVIAPFGPEGQRVQEAAGKAVRDAGLEVANFLDTTLRPGAAWAFSIRDAIRQSDLVIAILSGQNPNVFYELGVAHAMQKPTVLLVDIKSNNRLPAELDGLHYVLYDPGRLDDLASRIKAVIEASVFQRSA